MDYANLRFFKAAGEVENFTYAARELGISQAYLSQAIKRMEDEIGVPLFDRAGRKVLLNSFGKRLLSATDECLRIMDDAQKEINDALFSDRQTVRLVARCPLGDSPRALKGFYEAHPEWTVAMMTPGDDRVSSSYDLEFFASHEQYDEDNVVKLCDDHYVLLVSESHPLANRRSVSLSELTDFSFVMSPLSTEMTRVEKALFDTAGYRPNVRCYSSSYWAQITLVEQNVGVCIGCEKSWLVGSTAKICAIPFSDVARTRGLYVRWPKGSYLNEATLALTTYLRAMFSEALFEGCELS